MNLVGNIDAIPSQRFMFDPFNMNPGQFGNYPSRIGRYGSYVALPNQKHGGEPSIIPAEMMEQYNAWRTKID